MLRNDIAVRCTVAALFICLAAMPALAADAPTVSQVLTDVDKLLKENPMPAGATSRLIKIAEDPTASIYLTITLPGASLAPHVHKSHDETEYVISGTGKLFVNNEWVDIGPGNVHFNPMGKVHGAINNGKEPLVVLIMFTPAMTQTDRHFVK